jgi:hypothetical protein
VGDPEDERWNRVTAPANPGRAAPTSQRPAVSPFDHPRARFEEGAELGRGGMGRVYEARDVALDRGVAIKQALSDDAAILARFEREVRITARLQHPSIVPVLDAGRDEDGHPYYVMRKIEGQPLAARVSEARTAAARLALVPNVLAAVDAVAYAHARGVIHRDLKPWNILLGPFGETLVIDWGLARELDGDDVVSPSIPAAGGLTTAGRAFGTPGFMAPEQARGDAADRSSDVYALGATLAHVLVGAPPFGGLDPEVAIEKAARDEVPELAFPDEVPAELIAIATKAMSPSRSARYADAGELAGDLRRFLAGQLVAAHVYTLRERLARWSRKHKLAIAIALAAIVAIATISTIAIRNAFVARTTNAVAEAKATSRAEELLIERATAFAATSPTSAIAVLAQLPARSPRWDRARMVAESAAATGVAWGYQIEELGINARLVASPDGKTFAIASNEMLVIGDPSLRTPPRVVYRDHTMLSEIAWLDDRTVIALQVGKSRAIELIDRDGHARFLDIAGAKTADVVDGCRRPFALLDRKLTELDPSGGPPRRDLGVVTNAQCVSGGIIYSTATELIVERDGHPPVRGTEVPKFVMSIVANLELGRFALIGDDEVVEYSVDDRVIAERGRWSLDASHLAYWNDRLVAQESSGIAFLVRGEQPLRIAAEIARGQQPAAGVLWPRRDDMLVAGERMLFHVGTSGDALVPIAPFSSRLLGTIVTDRYVMALTNDGTVYSWDLQALLPKLLPNVTRGLVTAVDDRSAWLTVNNQVVHVDLATGATRTIADRVDEDTELICTNPQGAIIASDSGRRRVQGLPLQLDSYDARTHQRRTVSDKATTTKCSPRWLALATESTVELRDAARPDIAGRVFSIEGKMRGFALADRWLAIAATNDQITTIDLQTGRTARGMFEPFDAMVIDNHGRIATLRSGVVSLRSAVTDAPRAVTEQLAIAAIAPHDDGILAFLADHSVVVIDAAERVTRYASGDTAEIAYGAHELVLTINGRIALLDLRDGSTVQLPWLASQLAISRDGRTIAATRQFAPLVIFQRQVPADALGWMRDATNARLAPGSTVLTWPAVK